MLSNHDGSQLLKSASQLLKAFSISAIMPTGLNRKHNNTSNKSGVGQGPLYKMSFKLGPTVFELALNTTRSFVEL